MTAMNDLAGCLESETAPTDAQALAMADVDDLPALMRAAAAIRDRGHGAVISYSKKVFIPLTKLCRDSCHYCTFAQPPRRADAAYLSPDQVLAIAHAGARAGCREALFTLGDKPELRYQAARDALAKLGYATTLDYLAAMATLVFKETGLLPHLNPGRDEPRRYRAPACGLGVAGHHAGDDIGAAGREGRAALRFAGQVAVGPACDDRGRRRSGGAVHVRHSHRNRRDAARAHRSFAGAARPAPALRAHSGNHYPEFSRQADDAHGECAGARFFRTSLDDCRRTDRVRSGDEHSGASQPEWRTAGRRHRCGHQ